MVSEGSTLTQQGANKHEKRSLVDAWDSSTRSPRKFLSLLFVETRRKTWWRDGGVAIIDVTAWNRYVGWVFRRGTPAANCPCKSRKSRPGIPRGVHAARVSRREFNNVVIDHFISTYVRTSELEANYVYVGFLIKNTDHSRIICVNVFLETVKIFLFRRVTVKVA